MPFRVGTYSIDKAVLLAPMEDVTDVAFRLICKRMGADVMYTEFVNAEGLVRDSEKTKQKMMFLDEERPFGIQIYGGSEESMEGAAKMAEELRPDLIDINCGCWVTNVTGQGAGAALLRDLPHMGRVVERVVKSVNLPVTVKTRLGWDEKSIRIVEVAKMIEDTGAAALTIHCRTRTQGHKGDPDYSWIAKVKERVRIPIVVNGGIDSPEAAKRVFETTGCDGVMVARGALYNPWIFREIKHCFGHGNPLPPPTLTERIDLLLDHFHLSVQYKGEKKGVIEFRKYYAGYLRNLPGVGKLRAELMQYADAEMVETRLRQFAKSTPVSSDEEVLVS
jgi:tRNA-dihydrouridine synthase B